MALIAVPAASPLVPPAEAWFPGWLPASFPQATAEARGAGHWPAKHPIHVLMVEDDAAIADMYRVQLEHDGYRVTVATTGEIAFETLQTASPDIVLLDLLLPDRSGFEVMAAIKDRFPNHPPIVILSNYGEPTMIDRGRRMGAVEYLVKSRVTPGTVAQSIPAWIQAGRGRPLN